MEVGNLLRIAICDDDEKFAIELEKFILQFVSKNKIVVDTEIFTNSKEMLSEILNGYTCDLMFLDIELGDTTGVEIGKQIRSDIRNESMQIVFVSARESYAMQLFDIRPMNFLVKPVEYSQVEYIMEEYGRLFKFQSCFFEFRIGKDKRRVDQQTILYFQSQRKKIRMITQEGETEFYGKLSDIIPKLNEYSFCTVHKSYVINMRYVAEYGRDSIRMVNKDVVPVSRAMRGHLHQKIMEIGGGMEEHADNGSNL